MTDTVLSSASKEVVIGFDHPFVVIGERINPTGRKLLAKEMKNGDYSRVQSDALEQVTAGAQVLDVNAGIPLADEPAILAECIKLIQSITDVPLCIDSSIIAALEAGLEAYEGKPLLNSVTGEEERLEVVLPLVRKYQCAVVAISNDDTGISEDPNVRFDVARKIVERAADHGIPASDIVVDPLVMPIGAINSAGRQVMHIVKRLREELKVNTTCGASNLSFGLPNRHGLNSSFISMAIASGMTSAITNPMHADLMQAVRGANVVMGHDPECMQWIQQYRNPDAGEPQRGGRRSGRRRRSRE
ncbi:MAG: methyltetrahydrofolate cobalamin methyltransferase [Pseudomonadota bacterium]|nr:methyltetrahydrofolate cobalamin methyltransferase [Pseudomonadota bacterium]